MKELQILDVIGQVSDELVLEAKTSPAEKRPRRPLRTALIAAAAAVLVCATVLGAYAAWHWDEVLTNVFRIGEAEQTLMEQSVADVHASETRNGCVYTIKQIMGDAHCMVISLEVQLPEDLDLPVTTIGQLQTSAAENGWDWEETVGILQRRYGYEVGDECVTGVVLDFADLTYDADIDEATLKEEVEAYLADSYPTYSPDDLRSSINLHIVLRHLTAQALGVEGLSGGSGTLYRRYDPETHMYYELVYMQMDEYLLPQGRNCALVLRDLRIQDIEEALFSDASEKQEAENLLPEPLILRFKGSYEPVGRDFAILQDGEKIGTLTLSPFSAFLRFPLEQDVTGYTSVAEAANAASRKDYLGSFAKLRLELRLKDGTTVVLQPKSMGFGCDETAFFISERVVDLDQVEEISLHDFTFEPIE